MKGELKGQVFSLSFLFPSFFFLNFFTNRVPTFLKNGYNLQIFYHHGTEQY